MILGRALGRIRVLRLFCDRQHRSCVYLVGRCCRAVLLYIETWTTFPKPECRAPNRFICIPAEGVPCAAVKGYEVGYIHVSSLTCSSPLESHTLLEHGNIPSSPLAYPNQLRSRQDIRELPIPLPVRAVILPFVRADVINDVVDRRACSAAREMPRVLTDETETRCTR